MHSLEGPKPGSCTAQLACKAVQTEGAWLVQACAGLRLVLRAGANFASGCSPSQASTVLIKLSTAVLMRLQ
jgi:hypothetical protein